MKTKKIEPKTMYKIYNGKVEAVKVYEPHSFLPNAVYTTPPGRNYRYWENRRALFKTPEAALALIAERQLKRIADVEAQLAAEEREWEKVLLDFNKRFGGA